MSYSQAAGAGASSGSDSGSQPKDKFYNEKMVVCLIKGFTYEQLAEELNNVGSWKDVSGYLRVDLNRRIVMVVEDPEIRTFLAEKGFNVNGVHVFFSYHKGRVDLKTRVYISQLPFASHLWNSGKFLLSLVKLLRSIILPRSFKVEGLTLVIGY